MGSFAKTHSSDPHSLGKNKENEQVTKKMGRRLADGVRLKGNVVTKIQ